MRIDVRRIDGAPLQTLAPAHPWVVARRVTAIQFSGGLGECGLDLLLTLESPRFIDPPLAIDDETRRLLAGLRLA